MTQCHSLVPWKDVCPQAANQEHAPPTPCPLMRAQDTLQPVTMKLSSLLACLMTSRKWLGPNFQHPRSSPP